MTTLPALDSGQGGCLCCPPKPLTAPLDMQPHPGFGFLDLTRDGEIPEWWHTFCQWPTEPHYIKPEWVTGTNVRGEPFGFWTDTDEYWSLDEAVTLAEIEECCAEDPDHDWRLRIGGAMSEYTYQRQGCGQWVLVDKGMGFA